MKNTRENVIELLIKMRKHNHEIARILKKMGNLQEASEYVGKACELTMVIALLTDNDYFNKMNDIYNK